MKVAQINQVCQSGSTGKICVGISQLASTFGINNQIFYTSGRSAYPLSVKYGYKMLIKTEALKSRIFGNYGFNSRFITANLIDKLNKYNPDIIHLHNIHGHDVNFELLCNYLRNKRIKVIYTFHDCWAFTGYCPYFSIKQCDKWKTICNECPLCHKYSWLFDKSAKNFARKRKALEGLDMTVVTPSHWLAGLVELSFLKEYPIKVINNGIDLCAFKPSASSLLEIEALKGKRVVLGVADVWGERKGLDVFIELSKRLPETYQIVLVGTDKKVDKTLPTNIISIHRTQNQQQLADLYSTADLFVNPTREDNYPTVNMESLACGTPVLTFNTGGSPEILNESCGSVVPCDDVDALEKEIIRICETKPFSETACLSRAKAFDMNERFQDYINLYKTLA